MDCPFCNMGETAWGKRLDQNDLAYMLTLPDAVLSNSVMILPKRHIASAFDLSEEEWAAITRLLPSAKAYLDSVEVADGYNIGFNVGDVGGQHIPHVHMHVFARYKDEPLAGKGIRHALKQPENKRKT